MSIIKKTCNIIFDKERRFSYLNSIGFYDSLSDEKYLKKIYKIKVGRELNLDSPCTYTEKLQWLKLHDRKPVYTLMQDKFLVREYISKTIGEEYLIPLLGVWDDPEEINFDDLPDQFVLKCNHDCASVIICRDKSQFDMQAAIKELKNCLKRKYWLLGREWAYKDIQPKVIAEKYMQDGDNITLTDYKFFCCNGKVRMVMLTSGEAHTKERRQDLYDISFNKLSIKRGNFDNSQIAFKKPGNFKQMTDFAEEIAGNIPFIRVDFYSIDGNTYFGEIAFYPSGGFSEFQPTEWEERVGSWIDISEVGK